MDYIEFLESKYAEEAPGEASGLQSFAEKLEDQLRKRTVSPSSLREAFQLIASADKILSNVTNVGKELLGDLNGGPDGKRGKGPKGGQEKEGKGEGSGEGDSSQEAGKGSAQ